MEVTIVLVQRWNESNATHTFVLSMVVLLSGQLLVNARSPVVVEQRHGTGNVLTLNLSMVERHAQVQQRTQRNVELVLVQLMVATLHLEHGINVVSRAEVELKSEPEPVQILLPNMEVFHALSSVLL